MGRRSVSTPPPIHAVPVGIFLSTREFSGDRTSAAAQAVSIIRHLAADASAALEQCGLTPTIETAGHRAARFQQAANPDPSGPQASRHQPLAITLHRATRARSWADAGLTES